MLIVVWYRIRVSVFKRRKPTKGLLSTSPWAYKIVFLLCKVFSVSEKGEVSGLQVFFFFFVTLLPPGIGSGTIPVARVPWHDLSNV